MRGVYFEYNRLSLPRALSFQPFVQHLRFSLFWALAAWECYAGFIMENEKF